MTTQDQEIKEFLSKGLSFEEHLLKIGVLIRNQSKEVYSYNLLDARLTLISIYFHLINWKSNIPGITNQQISERLELIAAFFQRTYLVETAISEGQYFKAAAMLKQNIEIVTRIRELREGLAKNAKVPNVKNSPKGMNIFYSQLNDIAHISKPELYSLFLEKLSIGSFIGASPFPTTNTEVARNLYELHIWLLFEMVRELMILFTEMYGDLTNEDEFIKALNFLDGVIGLLKGIGIKFEKRINN